MSDVPKNICYRRAVSSDVPSIADFRWRLKTKDSSSTNPDSREKFVADFVIWHETTSNNRCLIHWVAEAEGKLLAVMSIVIVEKVAAPDEMNGRWGYLTNCYALPDIRNFGVGSGLLGRVRAWAESDGLEMLLVWPSRKAYAFYERAGFHRDRGPHVLPLK